MLSFFQVDVFTDEPFKGNPLAVFPDAGGLEARQMQAIAREMNLSETTFVSRASGDRYEMRIFTPEEELAFAGHPTLGTAWVLLREGLVEGDELIQVTPAGETAVRHDPGGHLTFTRTGSVEDDLERRMPDAAVRLGKALNVDPGRVGLEARELGRAGFLRPAVADVGVQHLLVPLEDPETLASCWPDLRALDELPGEGTYCFAAAGAGRIVARAFFSGLGIPEDPGTGSAAACLGLYLAHRVGAIEAEIVQGREIGRPCAISLKASTEQSTVGGRCALAVTGTLQSLP